MAHFEMVGAMVHQLMKTPEDFKAAGMGPGMQIITARHSPVPVPRYPSQQRIAYIMSKGDPIADIYEDMAAEQKARATYEHLIDLADDPDVIDPLR